MALACVLRRISRAAMDKTVAQIRMLVVDEHEAMGRAFRDGLKQLFGCTVEAVTRGLDALQLLKQNPADLLITNYPLPDMDGLALVTQVRQLYPATAIMLVSPMSSSRLRKQAARLGIHHILIKPVRLFDIWEAVLDSLHPLLDEASSGNEAHISAALEHWISQQAACSKPDVATQEVINLLDQWNRG